jgi:hypothetical protein
MLKQITSFVAAITFSASAFAGATYGFTSITNNNPGDAAIGEAQFSLEVIDGGGLVEFKFGNSGPDAVVMTNLYWDDDTNVLTSLDSYSPVTAGVDYSGGSATPGHLPGAAPSDFQDFSIQPKNPKPQKGLSPGENVSIFFTATASYLDVIEAMNAGDLTVGVRAQSFRSGGSEGFVTKGTPPTGVPSPSAALAGLGLMGLLVSRRGRRK